MLPTEASFALVNSLLNSLFLRPFPHSYVVQPLEVGLRYGILIPKPHSGLLAECEPIVITSESPSDRENDTIKHLIACNFAFQLRF